MFSQLFTTASCIGMLIAVVGCSPKVSAPPPPSITPVTRTIVVGDVSDEPAKRIGRFQPIADYLATHLHEFGIDAGEVKVAPDIETLAKWLASGEADLYFDSPYPALIVSDLSGAQPILRRWKNGVAEYHSVIFTRADRGLTSLDDLKGQTIVFEENFSTSGYMLPLTHLLSRGFNLVEIQQTNSPIANDEIGYMFSGDDQNSIQWVLSQRVTAAAVGSSDFLKIPEETRSQLTVLAETESLPRHLVMVSPTMGSAQQQAIKTLLLNIDETEKGQILLKTFEQTTQFDEFPDGADAALMRMRELYELTKTR